MVSPVTLPRSAPLHLCSWSILPVSFCASGNVSQGRRMEEWLNHPAVQGGVAPFVVALIVMLLLQPVRLGGLAVVAAFCTVVYFVAGFTFIPLTATRKIIVLGL